MYLSGLGYPVIQYVTELFAFYCTQHNLNYLLNYLFFWDVKRINSFYIIIYECMDMTMDDVFRFFYNINVYTILHVPIQQQLNVLTVNTNHFRVKIFIMLSPLKR